MAIGYREAVEQFAFDLLESAKASGETVEALADTFIGRLGLDIQRQIEEMRHEQMRDEYQGDWREK